VAHEERSLLRDLLKQPCVAIAGCSRVRIGQIAHQELERDWHEKISIDGIAERKSKSLVERKAILEDQLEELNRSGQRATERMAAFIRLDALSSESAKAHALLENTMSKHVALTQRISSVGARIDSLKQEEIHFHAAGTIRRAFLRSVSAITADLASALREKTSLEREAAKYASNLDTMKTRIAEVRTSLQGLSSELSGIDRAEVARQVEQTEQKRRPIVEEISDINKQLNDIKKSILENARIVGATVTKAYLSPQLFSTYNVVIVDEASMVMLPALFNAAGLAKDQVVISGDFRQLSPIIQTEQKEIADAIGGDVFSSTKIDKQREPYLKRLVMLKEQYRMCDEICRLVSSRMYKGDLKTAEGRRSASTPLPKPFDGALTIVDTSTIFPFVNKDPFNSRYNLMNALTVRNICRHITASTGDISQNHLGVCTPYAAQSKILQRVLASSDLRGVTAGTVHRYQGDEKNVIILDIPDSYGENRVGVFLEADHVGDSGAKLFNVAISRAQNHLIVVANLAYLDGKLPGMAILREILSNMQERGTVVDARDVLAFYPVAEDLRRGCPVPC